MIGKISPGAPLRAVQRLLFLPALLVLPLSAGALPGRLVLLVDGIAYDDMKALQAGVVYQNRKGRTVYCRGFHQGYFPVSRMISTFPSISDPAWTEMLGNRPLPGYQRTFFSAAANRQIVRNGITTTMEYERQMTWQVEGDWPRTLNYVLPLKAFKHEANALFEDFLNTTNRGDTYYAMIRSTDSAQHLAGDVFTLLCALDDKLRDLRERYKTREGRELEILILSDHGNNRAHDPKRLAIRPFLKKAGYRIVESLVNATDVVLPTAGIESWVEIHNAPAETRRLMGVLAGLDGVDVLTARIPDPHRILVLNWRGEEAEIHWKPERNSFRYLPVKGDPIGYRSVVEALSRQEQLDPDGFATADAWMAETMEHHYPLALERIVRGHTSVTLNPATILISLKNGYVHCGWWIRRGSVLVPSGGTHGGLDALNSTGILLSSFAPTSDTSSSRLAAMYDGFKGRWDYRSAANGAEWLYQPRPPTPGPLADLSGGLWLKHSTDDLFLRVWAREFVDLSPDAALEVVVEKLRRFVPASIRRDDPRPNEPVKQRWTLKSPVSSADGPAYERIYPFPDDLKLEPRAVYRISGRTSGERRNRLFEFTFHTGERGLPLTY